MPSSCISSNCHHDSSCVSINRFIEWAASGDILQLTETSLDERLDGNCVRIRFADAPILTGGVGVHETFNSVVVLAATVGSVHKIVFPHPERWEYPEYYISPTLTIDLVYVERLFKEFVYLMLSSYLILSLERLKKQFGEASTSNSTPSIFAEANIGMAKEHCHVLQTTGTSKRSLGLFSLNLK